jgi:hypothetical protein
MTEIPRDKIDAYLATNYMTGSGDDAFTMRIGTTSTDIEAIYKRDNLNCCLFITAFSPFGKQQSDLDNELAHAELGNELLAITTHVIEGVGAEPTGGWKPEKSFLAFGIGEQLSRELGAKYRQDAVVWVGENAIPQLLLLR